MATCNWIELFRKKKIHDFWFLSGCGYPLSSLSSSFVGDSSPWLQTVVRCSSLKNVPKLVLFSRGKFERILQDPPLIDVPDIEKLALKSHVLNSIKAHYMTPLYETLMASSILDLDQNLLASMRASNDAELKKLHEKIMDDAKENLGESEIHEAHLAKVVAVGQKMDLIFYTLQLAFVFMDFDMISKSIDKAKKLFEEGGDWERKNRLKALLLQLMLLRDILESMLLLWLVVSRGKK